jgi:hypothetical protein
MALGVIGVGLAEDLARSHSVVMNLFYQHLIAVVVLREDIGAATFLIAPPAEDAGRFL